MMNIALGDKLKQLRKEKGLTIAALAEMLGVSVGIISEWEHGRKEPRHSNREKLCELYEITEAELFQETAASSAHVIEEEHGEFETITAQKDLKEEKIAPTPSPRKEPKKPAIPKKKRRTARRHLIKRKITKIKKIIYREFRIFVLISAVIATIYYLNVGGLSSVTFMALTIWLYILYLLIRIGLSARRVVKTKKMLLTLVFLAILLAQVEFINVEIAFFSKYIQKAEEKTLTYLAESAAAAVVEKVLDSWKEGDYYGADLYRAEGETYKSLDNVKDYEIVDAFAIPGTPYTEIIARINSTSEEGLFVENLWRFLLRRDADGKWKIVNIITENQ
ncbi:helix-turn-helix domain-containing protein [Candidatus Omnitrophota bacterium]